MTPEQLRQRRRDRDWRGKQIAKQAARYDREERQSRYLRYWCAINWIGLCAVSIETYEESPQMHDDGVEIARKKLEALNSGKWVEQHVHPKMPSLMQKIERFLNRV